MKKTILTLALASVFGVVAAQKPAAGAMGFTGGLNGVFGTLNSGPSKTGSLQFKYYVNDGLAARVGLNIGTPAGNGTTVDTTITGTPNFLTERTTITSGGMGWALSLGAQKSLGGSEKLDVYAGADLNFGGATGVVVDAKTEVTRVPSAGGPGGAVVGDFKQTVTTNPGTFLFGINAVVGFQYFIVESLSLGAEYKYGWNYSSTSGSPETVSSGQTAGKADTGVTVASNDKMSTSNSNLGVGGGVITLSWYFSK